MKTKKYTYTLVFCFIAGLMFFASCKKNEGGNTDLYAYTSPGNVAHNVLSGGEIILLRGEVVSVSVNSNASFPVYLSRSYDKDVEVAAEIITDPQALETYNTTYNTTAPAVPAGAFSLHSGKVIVKSGQTSSADSIKIEVTDRMKLTPNTTYIVPVRLTTVSKGAVVSPNRQIMYARISITSCAASLTAPNGSTPNVNIALTMSGTTISGTNTVNLVGRLNTAVPKALGVSIAVDNSLIAEYNAKNNTDCEAFPAGAYTLPTANSTIPADQMVSVNNLQVHFPNLQLFQPAKVYLLPVVLQDDGSANTAPSDTENARNIAYIRVTVSLTASTSSLLAGYSLTSRTGWSIADVDSEETVGEGPNNGHAKHVLDNNTSTFWHSQWQDAQPSLPHYIVIDMGESRTLDGVWYTSRQTSTGRASNVTVLISNDNQTFTNMGSYNMVNSNSRQHMYFQVPVTARYIKLIVNTAFGTQQLYAMVAEIGGLQK